MFFSNQKKIYFFLLISIAIGIGLQSIIYKIATIALLLHWILTGDYKKKFSRLKKNSLAIGPIALYVLYAISLLWSENLDVAIDDIILKSPLLVFPLVILSQKPVNSFQKKWVLLVFLLAVFFLNLFCFSNSYLSFLKTGDINEFYYKKFVFNMHTAYQSMFTCFSILICGYLYKKENQFYSHLIAGVMFLQILFVLLIASRMQILIMIMITPIYILSYYYKKKAIFKGILYTTVIFITTIIFVKIPSSSLKHRYIQTVSQINNNDSDPRKHIWKEGVLVIKKNWVFGHGIGDAKEKLMERYYKLEKKHSYFLKKQYNFHNQYLETFAAIGIFGLFFLCLTFIYGIFFSIKKKNYFLTAFLIIVSVSFLTESMLQRQAGVVFFGFFYVFLIQNAIQNKLV